MRLAALFAAGCAALLPAQEPQPAPVAQVERATALLAAHGERTQAVQVLVADYVQRRTTALLPEPLVSKGQFLFVRNPAAVLFFAREPRLSTVRLTTATYEVYRPQKKQLERFVLEGPELAAGLFAVVGGDAERLRRDFVVVACDDLPGDGGLVQVRLVPKAAAARERLPEVVVTLHAPTAALRAVGYRDHAGDQVAIELSAVRFDPPSPPSGRLEVPPDTVVVEHAARRRGG
jgi:hypothetical protein